jgi:alpha-1,6-mannosyltransferase
MDQGRAFGKGWWALGAAATAGYSAVLLRDGLSRITHRDQGGLLGPSQLEGFHLVRGILNLCFLVAIAVYLIWLLRCREDAGSLSALLKKAAPFAALAFVAYPATTDVYTYLHFGSMSLRGVNPYLTTAGTVPIPEMPLLSNWSLTSPYGPISLLLFTICALPAPLSPILSVYLFKIFCLAAHLLNGALVWKVLAPGGLRNKLTLAYLVNPSLLSMHVAEGHLDVFVCTATILLIGAIRSGKFFGSSLAALAGALIKTLPVLWLPLLAVAMIRRRAWKALAGAILVSLVVLAILSATLLPTLDAWKGLANPSTRGMVARSIHHLASLVLEHGPKLDPEQRGEALSQELMFCIAAFGLFYLWTALKPFLRPAYSDGNLVADLGWVILLLFLAATPWVMPWYPALLLPIAVLSGSPYLAACTLIYSLSTGVIYGDGAGRSMFSVITTLVTIVPVLAALIWRRRVTERAEAWFARFT